MEKLETRVKCDSCGKAYKIKLPVTDRPVSFKCKNCGNVMKIKAGGDTKPSGPPPPQPDPLEGFETFGDFASDSSFASPAPGAAPQAASAKRPDSQPKKALSETPTVLGDSFHFEDSTEEDLAALSREPEKRQESEFKFETTQLPEDDAYQAAHPPQSMKTPSVVESLQQGSPGGDRPSSSDNRRWLTLVNEEVRGPFTNEELKAMIEDGSISPETSLRMGERPWIKASQVPAFRKLFALREGMGKLASISLTDKIGDMDDEPEAPFSVSVASLLPFPLGQGTNWQSLAIFAGIATVLCSILSLDFLIGLPICIIGWIVLYGYLGLLMQNSMKYPGNPPPPWDFKNIQGIATNGAKVFGVLFVYSLLPVTISMLFMIAFFLNGMSLLGYVFILITVLVFVASLFVVPASLAIVSLSEDMAAAVNPGNFLAVIKKGGQSYMMLAGVSVIVGLACMITVILGIFLVDIPGAGFLVVGILMGAVFSYGHFLWFHVVGLFSRSSRRLVGQVVSGAPVN